MSETLATVRVAQDLTSILNMHDDLEAEAINQATDHLMPGGLAMVALAGVADLREWAELIEAAEHRHGADPLRFPSVTVEDDDEWEPPLQTLLFWSEQWRELHGYPLERRPTLATEANFIRWAVDWAWDNETHFNDFAEDIGKARARLEDLLKEGLRAKRGVPCFDCNVDLVRPSLPPRDVRWCDGHDGLCTWPHKFCPHDRGGLADEWKCPRCDRRYGVEDYLRAVAQSALLNAEWLPLEDAIARTGAKRGSIQAWATRGHVARRKDVATGRITYSVADIETRRREDVA